MLSGVFSAGMESVTRIVIPMQQSENTVQSPNAVSMSGQRQRLWVNIETALGECHVFVRSIQQTSDGIVLASTCDSRGRNTYENIC